MGDMNFPDPSFTTEHDGWSWDGDKWTRTASSNWFDPTVKKVVTGTLANGDAVVLNADGTVSVVAEVDVPGGVGTPVVFNSNGNTTNTSCTYDPVANKVVIAYMDGGRSDYGTAIVGTVSGDSITFGSPTVFNSAGSSSISSTYDPVNSKVVISYRDNGNFNYGTAIVGTVSGNSMTFGAPQVFDAKNTTNISSTYDSVNNKVVIAYKNGSPPRYGTAVVGTVSGSSISFGSPKAFNNVNTSNTSTTYDSANNKVVISYHDQDNSDYGTAIVGAVSGDDISFGTPVVFNAGGTSSISSTYDSVSNKVVISYQDKGNSDYGTAIVGTVSGDSITFGTPVVFNGGVLNFTSAAYDPVNNKVAIAYADRGNSNYGTVIAGTVSGDSISFDAPEVFNDGTSNISSTYDSVSNRVVFSYLDQGNSNYGTAVTYSPGGTATNLTDSNFLGFSGSDYSDGDTAKVLVNGAIADQSGLTIAKHHYVQGDGTVDTDDTGVFAGTALSSTELIVEGSNHG